MLIHPNIDPVAISLGPIKIHWYGIMYLLAFLAAYVVGSRRASQPHTPIAKHQVEDLIVYSALGVVLGGRVGYVFFYNFDKWLGDPIWLFKVWDGGMSFHGGLLGVILAVVLYARKIKVPFAQVMDFAAPMVPLGLGFGRIGNFIGQELWGRTTDVAWAMRFPADPEKAFRHPSQLYQAFLEGLVLFVIIYWFSAKRRPPMAVSALFLICYGIFRFAVEFVREPDFQLKDELLFGWMTRGQQLSLPMVVLGLVLFAVAYYRKPATAEQPSETPNSKNNNTKAHSKKKKAT